MSMATSANQGRDVQEVLTEIKSAPRLVDRHVKPNLTAYMMDDGTVYVSTPDRTYPLHENAKQQFFSKIAFPDHNAFNARLSLQSKNALIRELLAYRSDSGKAIFQKDLLLRTNPVSGEVVALLSNRYNPYDNHQVANSVGDGLGCLNGEYERQLVVIDEQEDYSMRTVIGFPDVNVNSPDGYDVWVGIDISNDETGNGSVKLIPAIFRLICTNGMVSCQRLLSLRSYHTKQSQSIEGSIISLVESLPKFVNSWQREANQAFKYSTPTFTDPVMLQEYLGKTEVSKPDCKEILRLWALRSGLEQVYQYNLYQLAQAVSFYAGSQGKRRQQLERLSHNVIHRAR